MADEKNLLDAEQDLAAQDAAFREQMAGSDDPQDKRWRQYDNAARAQEQQIGELSGVAKLYDGLTQARADRDGFREDNERTQANAGQWDAQYQGLDEGVVDRQREFQEGLKGASMDDIDALQGDIKRRQEELEHAIAARQGIALLPSERAAQQAGQGEQQGAVAGQEQHAASATAQQGAEPQQDNRADGLEVAMPAMDEWRARHRQRTEQESDTQGASSGGFQAYATSAQEAEENRQLDQDQKELAYQLGRTATTEEIDSYQAARAQTQAQGAAGESDDAHGSVTEGLRTGQERSNVNEQGQGAPGQDEKQGQAQGGEVVIPELGAARQNRQAKQEQGQGGAEPQPNSTYAQRQAAQAQQAQKSEQADQAGQTETAQDGMVRRRSQTSSQGMGL